MERKRKIKEYIKYFLFFGAFLLLFSSRVAAASEQDYFPIEQNKNGHFTDNAISTIANYFDDENNYIVVRYIDYNYYAIVFPKSTYINDLGQLCGEKNNALTHFSFYGIGVVPTTTYQFQLINETQIVNLQNYGAGFNYWQNQPSSNYNSNFDYISNLKIWTTNTSTKKLVINFEEEPTYTDADNDTYPNNFEKPNISDYYIPSEAPLFDGSSLEKAVESLYTLLKWYLSDPHGLPGLIQYVIDNTNWAIQKVINNIRNVVEDMVDTISGYLSDIKDWVDDIKDGIEELVNYITNPWDEEEFETQIEGSDFFGAIDTIQTNFQTFYNTMNQVEERDHFTLHYTTGFHPDIEVGGNRVPTIEGEISFDWLYPLRNIYRPLLWVVCLYEMFVFGSSTLSKAIGGK